MDAISFIAERKIEQALADGEFDNLPGMGKPLDLEDLSLLPPELRMAYTVLKNGGYIEKPLERGSPVTSGELLAGCPDAGKVHRKMRRLRVMLGRIKGARGAHAPGEPDGAFPWEGDDGPYLEQLLDRV
jgi:hypothetical protein